MKLDKFIEESVIDQKSIDLKVNSVCLEDY